jgi:hypothetical protein
MSKRIKELEVREARLRAISLNKILVMTAVMNQRLSILMKNMILLTKEISLKMHHGTVPQAVN